MYTTVLSNSESVYVFLVFLNLFLNLFLNIFLHLVSNTRPHKHVFCFNHWSCLNKGFYLLTYLESLELFLITFSSCYIVLLNLKLGRVLV